MNKRMMVEIGVAGAVVVATAAVAGVVKLIRKPKKADITVVKEEDVTVEDFKEE